MKKTLCLLLTLLLLLAARPGIRAEEGARVRLAAMTGPTAMGMVKLLADAQDAGEANPYEITLAGSADEITPRLIQGRLDIAAVPLNLAAVLHGKTQGGVRLIAVNALGVLYIVEKGGGAVQALDDLRGKTIYATGRGSTPEYVLTYLLAQYGLDIHADVTVEWRSEPSEVVALMTTRDGVIAMLPQPYVAAAQARLDGLRVAIDLTQAWDALDNGSRMITAGIVARTAFIQENPAAVEAFLAQYALSAAYVNQNIAEAAALVERFGIVNAAVAQSALPACNIVCLTGEDMRAAADGYLRVLHALSPASVGGAVPAEDFYYTGASSHAAP